MSTQKKHPSILHTGKITVPAVRARKGQTPLVCLTAYSTAMAKILDQHADILLVGDSVGMVVYGFDNTLPVTLDMMIAHGAAVRRGTNKSLVVVDMPFGSYQQSCEQAFANAARIMAETGCDAVKIEGGEVIAGTIQFLSERGIPVMAHIGLQPQSVQSIGGFRAQGSDAASIAQLKRDAKAISQAGAFSCVIEATVESLAAELTRIMPIPTIGIGASPKCDGQILVIDDVLGMNPAFKPKFAKKYADLAEIIGSAAAQYASDVRRGYFPTSDHCFGTKPKGKVAATKKI